MMSERRPDGSDPAEEHGLALPEEGPEVEIVSFGDDDPAPAAASGPAAGLPSGDAARLTAELEEQRGRHLRLRADFENFRKRVEREREESARRALAEPIRDLLPVVDNLERALAAGGEGEELRGGVELILRQLVDVLRRFGIAEIPALGLAFDPRVHEAVARVEDPAVAAPTVIGELQRGYWLNDRLLRPALVRVAVPADQGVPAAPATPAITDGE
jgi:molecular chaperone GrpE